MSKSVKRVVKNSFFHTFGALGISGLNFLLSLAYGRYLDPEKFGSLATSQNTVILWSIFVDLGLTHALIGALTTAEGMKLDGSRQGFRARDLVFRVLGIRLLGALVGSFVLVVWHWRWLTEDPEFFWQGMAFAPYLFALAFQQTAFGFSVFRGQQGLAAFAQWLGAFFAVSLTLYLLFAGTEVKYLLLAQSWGGFLTAALIFFILYRQSVVRSRDGSSRRVEKKEGPWGGVAWLSIAREAWPYAITFAVFVIWQRLDQLAVSKFLGLASAGQYAMAVRMTTIPLLFATSISFALFPDLQRVGRDAPEKVTKLISILLKLLWRYGILLSAFIVFAVVFVISPLLPKFESAMKVLPYFIPGVWAFWIQSFLVNSFFGVKKYKSVVLVHLISLVLFVLTLFPLTYLIGMNGSIIAFNVFCLSMAGVGIHFAKREKILPKNFHIYSAFTTEEQDEIRKSMPSWIRKREPSRP